MRINKQDTQGTKPLLGKGELGYDDYPTGGDAGRVYVGTGATNISLAKKSEVTVVDSKADTHIGRVDNPHTVTKAQVGLGSVDNTADSAKNVLSATKLTTTRNIALTGDVTGSVNFDGSGNVSIATTVSANSVALGTDTTGNYVAGNTAGTGITVSGTAGEGWSPTISITNVGTTGTYTKVTTNAQGQVTSGTTLSSSDIPSLDASKITTGIIDTARLPAYVDDVLEFDNLAGFPVTGETGKIYVALDTNKTYRWSGTVYVYITSGAVDSVNGQTGIVNITNITGNAGAATKLETPRTINGVAFDGSANITVSDSTAVKLTGNQTIDGIKTFSSDIIGTITGNSSTASALQTARTLTIGSTGKTFDGTANVSWSVAEIGAQPVDADLTAISALAGTSGLLKKTAANTWTLDTNTYVTSSGVTSVTGTAPIVSSGGNTPAISISAATTSAAGSMSAADKTKLDGIAAGAQVNVATDLSLGTATATTLPLNSSTGADVVLPAVTTTTAGLMGSADKVRLDGIATNANNYTLPTATSTAIGGVKVSATAQTVAGNAVTATASRSYAVQLDASGNALVNVPWVDTNTVYTHPTSGVTAGSYSKVTVDANGHVTAGLTPTMEDIPDATFKRSVRAATTANITLSATQTIDGIVLAVGDRVLVKDQTTSSQNGIYVVAAGAWTRALDADTASKIASALVAVDSGTVNGGKLFDNDFKTTDTLGTTAMAWASNLDSGSLSSTTPLVAGTAAIGTGTTVARADHVHPAQTTITGNAGTATTLQTARTISGVSFNGSANIEIEDRLGTAIASSATTTIGTRGLGDYIHITGAVTITSLGTAAAAGIRRTLIFDGALTLTHNATSLICPGAANIVTVAGTVIEVVAETTANWRVVSITHPSLSMAEIGYLDGVTSAIQTQLNAKAALASPTLTGTPTAPTAAVGTNTTQVATTAFVNAEIANDAVPRVTSTDNAIVRFNGITGDVQDSGITIDDSGNIGSGTQSFNGYGGSGFKNYIINGNFDIWQRGLGPFTNFNYGADRWVSYNATAEMYSSITSTNGVQKRIAHFKNVTADTSFLAQAIELPFVGFGHPFSVGKKFTVSVRYSGAIKIRPKLIFRDGVVGANPVNLDSTMITPIFKGGSVADHTVSWTFTVNNPAAITNNCLVLSLESETTASDIYIYQVQLEEGSVATPFEQRPYELELSLCQRYYELGKVLLFGAVDTVNTCVNCFYKVTKRVSPTLNVTCTNTIARLQSTVDNFRLYVIGQNSTTEVTEFAASAEL